MAALQRASAPPRGGQTQVQSPASAPAAAAARQAVLHLRGATVEREEDGEASSGSTGRRIQWAEDVVDNEGLGRKKSKVCCIYHAPKGIDESSDESSSDDDDSDSGDDGAARPTRREGSGHGHEHGHGHGHDCEHSHGKGKGKGRARSPNAYEKMPKPKSGGAKEKG
ncbi:hypothetical protein M430DRAFT_27494 [Amorphotheca resinae ATCC 22711]|uniref:Type 1 phosphatases regulator n=1 Tax=Amorphotheca resinae ATCC 22711 TaxID=857342 RepID=A0A2T3B473_AMORE|nr:hypothetical protein M430DRAFT_27494 [Amorphotheca resinae ATCC 22711]PSS20449.1 hypothetical protein M430DRAFT_27494 [Amorphotheca resinae ATCC 22711]